MNAPAGPYRVRRANCYPEFTSWTWVAQSPTLESAERYAGQLAGSGDAIGVVDRFGQTVRRFNYVPKSGGAK